LIESAEPKQQEQLKKAIAEIKNKPSDVSSISELEASLSELSDRWRDLNKEAQKL
jgi:hypothetical protein